MEALWATILFSGFALEVIIRHLKEKETRVEARYKLMATELNKSWYEVKRLVQSAKKRG